MLGRVDVEVGLGPIYCEPVTEAGLREPVQGAVGGRQMVPSERSNPSSLLTKRPIEIPKLPDGACMQESPGVESRGDRQRAQERVGSEPQRPSLSDEHLERPHRGTHRRSRTNYDQTAQRTMLSCLPPLQRGAMRNGGTRPPLPLSPFWLPVAQAMAMIRKGQIARAPANDMGAQRDFIATLFGAAA